MIPLRDSVRLARWPIVTIALIAANVIAYLLAIRAAGRSSTGRATRRSSPTGAIPYEFTHLASHCALGLSGFAQALLCTGQPGVSGAPASQPATWETAFTSMFLHANIVHLGGNMVFLAVFGATLEDTLGRLRFLAFYLPAGSRRWP